MHVILRLYRMHDYDIMLLKYNKHVNFSKTVRSILRSFADHKIYNIDYSEVVYDIDPKNIPYKSQLVINFDEEKDKKVIEMLLNIKDGYRNSFIRDVIRLYTSTFFLTQYQIEKRILPTMATEKSVKPFNKKEKKYDNFTKKLLTDIEKNNDKKEKKKEESTSNTNLLPGTNRLNPTAAKTAEPIKKQPKKGTEQITYPAASFDNANNMTNVQPEPTQQSNNASPFADSAQSTQDDFDFFKNLM